MYRATRGLVSGIEPASLESDLLSLTRYNRNALPLRRHQRRTRLRPARRLPLLTPGILLLALRLRLVGVKVPSGRPRRGGGVGAVGITDGRSVALRGGEGSFGC